MADDKTKKRPQDTKEISLDEPYERQYWSKSLGVTQKQLRELVKEHGHSASAVRKAINKDK